MKGDFKIPPSTPPKYTGVNQSQGRVAMDQDWNETSGNQVAAVSEKLAGRTGMDRQAVREIMTPLARLGDGLAGAAEKMVRELAGDRWHPEERHVTLDPASGEIRFGDGARGARPAAGQNNITATYPHGTGAEGTPAAALPPFPAAITEPESASETLSRGLQKLDTWLALAGAEAAESGGLEPATAGDEPATAAQRLNSLRRELIRQTELTTEVGARRLHYFDGKQLSAADFRAEQDYASGRSEADPAAGVNKSTEPRKQDRIDPADLHLRRREPDDDD
ncbi:MAG: hypothetical protein JXQ27_11185 [Acidobacteria bacterium]|nr:hypothetical protein [Acidobacteriota bacterium]